MSRYRINIERLNISLHGVSAIVAEQASQDLEAELKRQLGAIRVSQRGGMDPGFVDFGPLQVNPNIDGATLRSLIAERLSAVLHRELQTSESAEDTDAFREAGS